MAEYAFGADEYVVMKAQEITPDAKKGLSSMRASELILTNHNIVLPVKGLTGKVKGYEVYPLRDIRIVDGRPQCRLDKSDFMDVKLELSMNQGLVSFKFGSLDNKKEVRAWINAIYQLLVGHDAPEEAMGKGRFESMFDEFDEENVADTFGRMIGTFEGAFEGAFQKRRDTNAADVSTRCPSCNASVKGRPGETAQCPYCGSYVTLPHAN